MRKALLYTLAVAGAIWSVPALAAGGPTCGLGNGQVAKGEPIVIGAVVGQPGPDDFSSSAKSAAAYFACVNANGGVNGRPVTYLARDDQWSPEIASQVAARLVTDQKVVAMVGSSSFVECGANAAFYAKNDVVSFSGAGVPRECFTAQSIAPFNAGPRMSLIQDAQFAHRALGANSFVCISLNVPGMGDWVCNGVAEWARSQQLVSKTILIDPGSADATSTILQAAGEKPDAIILGFSKGLTVALLNAAEQQDLGGKAKFLSGGGGYNADVPASVGSYWNDRLWVNLELNLLESSGPDNRNWQGIMAAYGKEGDPRDTFSQAGYLAAKAATSALLTLDPSKLDRGNVARAMRAVSRVNSDILCQPWYFGAGVAQHNAVHATRMAVLSAGAFKVVSDCHDTEDPELANILKAEASLPLAN